MRDPAPAPADASLRDNRPLQLMVAAYAAVWAWAAIDPVYPMDWLLENLLTFATVGALLATRRRFVFSNRSYFLILLFMSLHAIGGHYTYGEVPLGRWLQEALGLERNHFDRIVHFAFGLLWAYPLRELGLRLFGATPTFATLAAFGFVLACGAGFEIIEWIVASLVDPKAGAAYLGTQGDEFDSQKDMALAGLGGLLALAVTIVLPGRASR